MLGPKNLDQLGEGPHWDADNECLYHVDIRKKIIRKYDWSTGEQHSLEARQKLHTVCFRAKVLGCVIVFS